MVEISHLSICCLMAIHTGSHQDDDEVKMMTLEDETIHETILAEQGSPSSFRVGSLGWEVDQLGGLSSASMPLGRRELVLGGGDAEFFLEGGHRRRRS